MTSMSTIWPPLAAALFVSALSGAVSAQEAPPDQTQRAIPSVRQIEGFALMLPEPISERYFDLYCRILQLDDDERTIAETLYWMYINEWADVLECDLPELAAASKEAARAQAEAGGIETHQKMLRLRKTVLNELSTVDERLLTNLMSILDEAILPRYEWIQQSRRRTSADIFTTSIPFADIDLVGVLFQIYPDNEQLPNEVWPIIERYDREGAIALAKRAEGRVERMFASQVLHAQFRASAHTAQLPGDDSAVLANRDNVQREGLELSEKLYEGQQLVQRLNKRFLPQFVAALPPKTAKQMDSIARQQSYPRIYPDPLELSPIFNELAALDLDVDTKAQTDAVRSSYIAQHDAVCRQMERRFEKWKDLIEPQRFSSRVDARPYRDEMLELHERRRRLSESTLAALKATIPEERLEELPSYVAYKASVERLANAPWSPPG